MASIPILQIRKQRSSSMAWGGCWPQFTQLACAETGANPMYLAMVFVVSADRRR